MSNEYMGYFDREESETFLETNTTPIIKRMEVKSIYDNNIPLSDRLSGLEDFFTNDEEDNTDNGDIENEYIYDKVTFETICKNLSARDSITEQINDLHIVKTFTTDNGTIIMDIDMETENIVKYTLSGDVPSNIPLVKTITKLEDNKLDIKYTIKN
jgi:hypothetical protein